MLLLPFGMNLPSDCGHATHTYDSPDWFLYTHAFIQVKVGSTLGFAPGGIDLG